MTLHLAISGLTLNFCTHLQAFCRFDLVVFAISCVHGRHAFTVEGRHRSRQATGQYQGRTHQQGTEGYGRVSEHVPIHRCFLCTVRVIWRSLRLLEFLELSGKASQVRCLRL